MKDAATAGKKLEGPTLGDWFRGRPGVLPLERETIGPTSDEETNRIVKIRILKVPTAVNCQE